MIEKIVIAFLLLILLTMTIIAILFSQFYYVKSVPSNKYAWEICDYDTFCQMKCEYADLNFIYDICPPSLNREASN